MSHPVIEIRNISKRYIIGENLHGQGARTFRDVFDHRMRQLFRRQAQRGPRLDNTIWAVRDVSFDVGEGEAVGLIGRNGAGKSTLLKILSRITEPTSGTVRLRGRVASLLEVGTGFNLELTGRENIFLNGAILGMRKSEIVRKFDEIVDFAEVEKFIDTPVKRYSSGMYLRLAFAVAAHLEPEILIVDEVLAVGDIQFQKKCMGKMQDVSQKQGRTVIFVSHNMEAINQLCGKCALMERGVLRMYGRTPDVVGAYLRPETNSTGTYVNPAPPAPDAKLYVRRVSVLDEKGSVTPKITEGETVQVRIEYDLLADLENTRVGIMLKNKQGTILFRNGDADVDQRHYGLRRKGSYINVCRIPSSMLKNGDYYVTVFADIPMREWLAFQEDILNFEYQGFGGEVVFLEYPTGVIKLDLAWDVCGNGMA